MCAVVLLLEGGEGARAAFVFVCSLFRADFRAKRRKFSARAIFGETACRPNELDDDVKLPSLRSATILHRRVFIVC